MTNIVNLSDENSLNNIANVKESSCWGSNACFPCPYKELKCQIVSFDPHHSPKAVFWKTVSFHHEWDFQNQT